MTRGKAAVAALIALAGVSAAYGSGPIRVYALIERVVFEGPEDAPEAVRVYGAFTFVEERLSSNSTPQTGYMYFRLPPDRDPHDFRLPRDARELTWNEWRDFAEVAGTGEAVAFGAYSYSGNFDLLGADSSWPEAGLLPYAGGPGLYGIPRATANLTVRPESSSPTDAAYYAPGIGVVRLGEGNHGAIVEALRSALN
jgi:hypothetical protein